MQTLADGRAEYEDGLREYEDGLAEFEAEIADAEAEIADAKAELSDLEAPELFVLTRETNTGYVTFESDSQIVEKLSALFPVFFLPDRRARLLHDDDPHGRRRTDADRRCARWATAAPPSIQNICCMPAAPPRSAA